MKNISKFYNQKVLQKDAKSGSFGYMFRNIECLVLNTLIILSLLAWIF